MPDALKRRLSLFLLLALVVPFGLVARFHLGPGWLRNAFGAMLYEIAWILLAQIVWIHARTGHIALGVFAATAVVELLQLSEAGWLCALRNTMPGRLLLGANGGFDWMDFPLYLAGCLLGYVLCRSYPYPKRTG